MYTEEERRMNLRQMDFGRSQIARAKYGHESETDGPGRQRDRCTCSRDRKIEKDGFESEADGLGVRETGGFEQRQIN